MPRADPWWAIANGALALVVYVRTLAPGLVATVDTPMFQFIGRVLGVPHNPGYPLYVLLTHPVSYLPIGTLPYRINLFSAVLGAVAVSLVYLLARRLGCRRLVGAAAALGFAFGHVFWSQAVIAEVYTMYAAILAGMLLALLTWRDTRRPAHFFMAAALFAAGLAHHTTIAVFAPAAALYAFAVDRAFVLRLRTLAVTAAIVAGGFLPYLFILVRSRDPDAYVESRAPTLGALADVVLARQFQDRLFAFDWRTTALDRIPAVFKGVLLSELTVAGVLLAAAGFVWLVRRRPADAVLLVWGVAAIAGFAVVYRVVDMPVFLIPALLVSWVLAGAGGEAAARIAARLPGGSAVAAVAVAALPAWLLAHNLPLTDRSRDTDTAVHFDALFEVLPARTALVHEDFLVDRVVMFKLLGEGAARGRDIRLAPRDAEAVERLRRDGFAVFAFQKSARALRQSGAAFSYRPLHLVDGAFASRVMDVDDDAVVAFAVPGRIAGRAGGLEWLGALGVSGGVRPRGPGDPLAALGVRGSRDGGRVQSGGERAHLAFAAGRRIGSSRVKAPSAIEVRAEADAASIVQDGREVVSASHGAVAAIWTPAGRLARALVLEAAEGFRMPLPAGPLAVYPLVGTWNRWEVGAAPSDITGAAESGSLMVRVPRDGAVVVYAAANHPLAPVAADRSSGEVSVGLASFENANAAALREVLASDGVDAAAVASLVYVYRIEVAAGRDPEAAVLIALGGRPASVQARVAIGKGPARAFAVDLAGLLRSPDRQSEVLLMTRDEQSQLVGAGWSRVDWDAVSAYRWVTGSDARLLLPVTQTASRLRLQALLEPGAAPASLSLRIGGAALPARAMLPGWQLYEWALPADLLVPGTHDAVLMLDRQGTPPDRSTGRPGVAVSEVRLLRD